MPDVIEVSSTPEEKEEQKEKEAKGKNTLALIKKKFEKDTALKDLLVYNQTYQVIQFNKPFKYIKKGEEMTDDNQSEICFYLSSLLNRDIPQSKLMTALTVISKQKIVNPIKDYLDGLKWDGTPRLGTWLHKYLGADYNEYSGSVGKTVLVAAVARIYQPGIKYDYMMILEGRTRIGKSRLLQALGGEWYLDMHLEDTNKDIIDNMRGKWIIEVSEMAGFGKREDEWLKAFLSRAVDRVRLSYGRRSQDYPRQSILIGSRNQSGDNTYFKDDTGNARYWPIQCGDNIKVDRLAQDRDMLFAEAMSLYKQHHPLYLTGQAFEMAEAEQDKRLQQDVWYWDVMNKIKNHSELTAWEILEKIGIPPSQRDRYASMRIGTIMKQLGWAKRQRSSGDRYYTREETNHKGEAQDSIWEESQAVQDTANS